MEFPPTYLYVKRHALTGKFYLGKTIKANPVKYSGSGLLWTRHCKVHGYEHIETIWHQLFTDQQTCTTIAGLLSSEFNVVDSEDWLNMVPENGLNFTEGMKGRSHSAETRAKQSIARSKHVFSPETRAKLSARQTLINLGRKHSAETKAKISAARASKLFTKHTCPDCLLQYSYELNHAAKCKGKQ